MPRPPNKKFDLKARIDRLKAGGFTFSPGKNYSGTIHNDSELRPLPERIRLILRIIQSKPEKSTSMNYLILYDIENDQVRNLIAKYLLSKGCIRIQKSVFLVHSDHKQFDEIKDTLAGINETYDNHDSIILIPLNVSDARSMKLIGQNVNIDRIIDPPNTVFI